ncbi:hypothetical protein BGAL_0073g00060 [Botrytis galanthina]|uniref:NmrA-like domain-containing protein n=1 Tax=Botrytis galanthina TaxID=278940 RepID=A0A4S8R6W1_9HELO|nr:hypothetical protein BGAL_0073g00060 [Botrytis galanthina]
MIHKGPIIRISPYELHVIEPDFFEKLYRQDGRWHKYLANKQDLIRQNVQKLCDRIPQFTGTRQIANLGAATSAFTRDVSTEFILGKSYNSHYKEGFDIGMTNVFPGSGHIWRITKYITWLGPTMKSIPVKWVIKVADDALSDLNDKAPRTTLHQILDSNLPARDKKFERVFDGVATVTEAGFETTASVLRLIIFHVFNNPKLLKRLREELSSTSISSYDLIEVKTLEQHPYLISIMMEVMRLSPAIASRSARISPDRDLTYGNWRIPTGTPIGMTTLLMHVDEKLYPDPMHFNPERLAWAKMYMLLAALVQLFDFQFEGVTSKDSESSKLDDLNYERRQAEKSIKVAKEIGVKQVIASTSLGVSMLGTGIHIAPNPFIAKQLAGKKGVGQVVIDANFEHWKFLRPAFFMENFLEPKVYRYRELRDKVATAAFEDPEKFHECTIGLASELLTVLEILDQFGEVIQRPLEAVFITKEEIKQQKDSNFFVNSQIAMRYMSEYVDIEELSRLASLTTIEQFLAREEDIVKRTYL